MNSGSSDNVFKAGCGVVEVYPSSSTIHAIEPDEYSEDLRTTNSKEKPSLSFFDLPGEIRNQIYRCVLKSDRPYAVQLQFKPLDTAILRLNKQTFAEASSIFYHENCFRFPQALFVGASILPQLEGFYKLSRTKLLTMRHILLEVPVSNAKSIPVLGDKSILKLVPDVSP